MGEHAGDELAGLGGCVDEHDVFEAALDLGPLALLGGVGGRGVVAECKVLHRDKHNRRAAFGLGRLGEELKQVEIRVRTLLRRFKVLAKLIDDEQERCPLCECSGDVEQ